MVGEGLRMTRDQLVITLGGQPAPMLKLQMATVPQSSKPSVATMKPLPYAKKPQTVERVLKMSRPWADSIPNSAKSTQQNDCTRKAAGDTVVSPRSRLRFLTSSWA